MDISGDVIVLVFKLLPGFVAAWIFYGLTAYRRESAFERVVQALVFTGILQALNIGVGWLSLRCGGKWTDNYALVSSMVLAVLLGVLVAFAANRNAIHNILWKMRITNGSSYPSEWYKVFASEKRWVVLHLKGERRLFGWPTDWPDHPDSGHFVIADPEWLLDSGERAPLFQVFRIIVPVTEVEMVELVQQPNEINANEGSIAEAMGKLLSLRHKPEVAHECRERTTEEHQ